MIDAHNHVPGPGVRMVSVGIDPETCAATLAATERFPDVYAAIGCHPNNAELLDEAQLRADAAHPRCVAVGETGLDYYRDRAPRPAQRHAFEFQIALAHQLDKALVIHTRDAADDTLALLREQAKGLRVMLHCFSMPDHLDECIEAGWWISFAGNVTYPANEELARAAERVPPERLLVETDAPYLAPQSHRGKPNEPGFVRETAQFIAVRRGIDYAELETIVEHSAAALFGW